MQDRVLGDVSWTRGQCQKHECRSQQADVHGFEPQLERATWQNGGVVLLPPSHRTRSARALTPRKVDGTRPPNQRWASADLSQGSAYESRPGLFSRQGPSRGAELRRRIDNVSSREVSKDGGSTARRRPNLSITSPYESIVDSPCRPPLPLPQKGRLDVQAASLTFARFENTSTLTRVTVSTHRTFLRSLRFSRFEATPSTPRKPDWFSHTILFSPKPSFARFKATPSTPRKPDCFPN